MLEIVNVKFEELFVRVTAFAVLVVPTATLRKSRVEGESCIVPWTAAPVPGTAIVCVLFADSSRIWMRSERDPPAAGENVTVIAQLSFAPPCGVSCAPQLLVWA